MPENTSLDGEDNFKWGRNRCAWVLRLFGTFKRLVIKIEDLSKVKANKTICFLDETQPNGKKCITESGKGLDDLSRFFFTAVTDIGIVGLSQDGSDDRVLNDKAYFPHYDGLGTHSSISYVESGKEIFWLTDYGDNGNNRFTRRVERRVIRNG